VKKERKPNVDALRLKKRMEGKEKKTAGFKGLRIWRKN